MTRMAKVTINNVTVDVPNGTSAMDAIFHAGSDVPLFCAEKHLSPVGACRMCLVKTGGPRKNPDGSTILDDSTGQAKIFWAPKLVASCVTSVTDGMVIDTVSDEVKHAQAGMVELTLFNHPLDCPTCDKGGACELQDRTMEYGLVSKFYQPNAEELPMYTRFEMTRRHVDKHHALSDLITLDRERCIHCKRCIRYFDEVPGDNVLDFIERGVHTFISTEDEGMPSNFTGNIVDICPVGALLDQTARFRGRNWEYDSVETTSMDDSAGAGIVVDARSGSVERIRAAERPEVNEVWISDAARFGHEWVGQNRVAQPMVRRNGQLVEATWDEAADAIELGLADVASSDIGIYLNGNATLEEGFVAKGLSDSLGSAHRDFAGRTVYPSVAFPAATFSQLIAAPFVLVLGDPTEENPTLHLRLSEFSRGITPAPKLNHGTPFADLNIKEKMPRLITKMALFNSYPARLAKWAGAVGIHKPGDEVALLSILLEQTSELPSGVSAQAIETTKTSLSAGKAVILIGSAVLNDAMAAAKAKALAEKYGAGVMTMTPAANARGLESLGLVPSKGGADWTSAAPKAAYFGFLPTEAQLKKSGFKILHLTHSDPIATKYADVLLPNQVSYEKRGHTVNLEGRVSALNAAGINIGQADGAVAALNLIADALDIKSPAKLIRAATKALDLPEDGKIWKAKASASIPTPVANPFTGITLRPTMWRAEQLVGKVANEALLLLEMSPATAKENGLADGFIVEIETQNGLHSAPVRLVDGLPDGAMYLPALGIWSGRRLEAKILVGGVR